MDGFRKSEVLAIQDLSPSVKQFRISYPWSGEFLPGQFIMLNLPIEAAFTTRSYSIASAPNNEGWIELCIVRKPAGPGTEFLFEELEIGAELWVSEPQGKFVLEQGSVPLCFVCTGTGIAPFRSMILGLLNQNGVLDRKVSLVFGNRYKADILYGSEWEDLQNRDPNFSFIPVLSREENWEGARGYVHPSYLSLAEKNPETCFYLCGWTSMVREAKNNLKSLGFSRKQLKFELYD